MWQGVFIITFRNDVSLDNQRACLPRKSFLNFSLDYARGVDFDGLFVVPVDEFLVAEVITADQERRDFSSNDSDYSTIHDPVPGWNVAPLR